MSVLRVRVTIKLRVNICTCGSPYYTFSRSWKWRPMILCVIFFQNFLARKCPERNPEMCWKCTPIRSRSIQTQNISVGGGGAHPDPQTPDPNCFKLASLPTRFTQYGPIIRHSAYHLQSQVRHLLGLFRYNKNRNDISRKKGIYIYIYAVSTLI